jgi:fatty-acyl-CoA synthase
VGFGHLVNSGTAVDVSCATAVYRFARRRAGDVVVRYAGGDLTWADLDDRAARLAGALRGRGVEPGDRVAYTGLNSPAYLVTMLASFRLGAIFVPVNFRLAGPELQRVLEASGAVALVSEEGHRTIVDGVREKTALRTFLLVDDDPEVPVTGTAEGWQPWSAARASTEPVADVAPARFDDVGLLLFTSGTTGLPKGVALTHGNIWWNMINVGQRLDVRSDDVTHVVAPLFHIGALSSFVIGALVRGGTIVLRRSFDPAAFLDDLVRYRVNSLFAVPAMLAAAVRVDGFFAADLAALRAIVVAGASVPPSLVREFAEHGIWVEQAWGLTETAPFATHLPRDLTLAKLGSAGMAMPYTQVRVVDLLTNEPVAPGRPGELVVRGPNVTPGYWENPAATAAAFDDEGWFHSGDIGYVDPDGCVFIVDRLKDMIITGGENVYPAEVERAYADMPGIMDIAVVGIPDEKWGETVVAVVSLADESSVTLEALRDYGAARLARYKLPHRVKVVEWVPRNASGKLEKPIIRALVEAEDPA